MKNLVLTAEQWKKKNRTVRKAAIPFTVQYYGPLYRYEDTFPTETAFQQEVKEEVKSWPAWKRKAAEAPFKMNLDKERLHRLADAEDGCPVTAGSRNPIGGSGESTIPFHLPERYVPHSDATKSFLAHLDSLTPQALAMREIEAHMDSVFYKHHGDALGGDICDGFFDEP